jgi:peptidoglycan L-alanyl-D-glutamate endopeptidase CwlK
MINNKERLAGVHPSLVNVVNLAATHCTQNFSVHDGVRTLLKQKMLVKSGASKTLNSKHLIQPDGFGHAVDLVPIIAGELRWEWPPIFVIATAMDKAATELGVKLRWGGVWDKTLMEYGGSAELMDAEVKAYCERHPGPDFIDGPHWELVVPEVK